MVRPRQKAEKCRGWLVSTSADNSKEMINSVQSTYISSLWCCVTCDATATFDGRTLTDSCPPPALSTWTAKKPLPLLLTTPLRPETSQGEGGVLATKGSGNTRQKAVSEPRRAVETYGKGGVFTVGQRHGLADERTRGRGRHRPAATDSVATFRCPEPGGSACCYLNGYSRSVATRQW